MFFVHFSTQSFASQYVFWFGFFSFVQAKKGFSALYISYVEFHHIFMWFQIFLTRIQDSGQVFVNPAFRLTACTKKRDGMGHIETNPTTYP